MIYILTVSSQGQIVIPSQVRKAMGLIGGEKIKLRLVNKARVPTVTIEPDKIDWVKRMEGIASGVYGDVDKYIEKERASWDKDKSWP